VTRRLLFAATLLAAGFLSGLVLTGHLRTAEEARADATAPLPAAPMTTAPGLAAGGAPDFTAIARQTIDAVTNISSLQPLQRSRSPFMDDPFFRRFFGDMDMFGQSRPELSLGSGVVVSPDGYILTNVHVLGDLRRGTEVRVALSDKREMTAQVVGADQFTDIALVKIHGESLPTIPWGDSSELQVAEWVLAIGNPYQLSQTVTLGIVSALGRSNIGAAGYEDFIQTDAAINPGNSGGALINGRGQLVGINTAIFSQSGGYQGIGFAVPSNLARRVMDDLIKYGEVRRGTLGYFEVIPITDELAREIGLRRGQSGVVVARIDGRSAAYGAGLRPADAIVAFNATKVEDAGQLQRLIADAPIGSTVTLSVLRGDRSLELEVTIVPASRARR
jgi:Do/DeqQ family serine protease